MAFQNLNFHQTFVPEGNYLSGILNIADEAEKWMDLDTISRETGIPQGESSGKIPPHINYAQYMGLIKYETSSGKYGIRLTDLGRTVKRSDPYLRENVSALLCHYMITRENGGAIAWSFGFHRALSPTNPTIQVTALVNMMQEQVSKSATRKNISPFIGSYVRGFFSPLEILTEDKAMNTITEHPVSYRPELIYVYAFALYQSWDSVYRSDEITANQLHDIQFRQPFGWNADEEYIILEHMQDHHIIRLNRQLSPYSIVRLTDTNKLLDCMYSELC